ncbi:BREX-5 system adenine-specific DNA-methyltransferase PglX [Halobacteriaceae archaeon SHR40]|uniref:BREX-5 system adenine-specific DNA-methyltransferase PglX n=1 Tax=Halovenus amylolytica TaxID=2500550 RepID=UPI000FE36C6B
MFQDSNQFQNVQLDNEERTLLEETVTRMRDRVEANVRYQLEEYNLEERPDENTSLNEEEEDLVEAIELEAIDGNEWTEGYEQYITSVGYTIVNRLAALRCMEVRDFIDNEVTVFRDDGLTPAAARLVDEQYMLEEEAVLEAYRDACDYLGEEIEILFDRTTAYSLIDPDDDTFEDLCKLLDEISNEIWRADDVLGWVYEYYNSEEMEDLRRKGDYEGLRPMDVPPANQFYTPHWVVRMLTDNSLGRLYLEETGELEEVVSKQESMSADDRKNREATSTDTGLAGLCTYLVPSADEGNPPDFDKPEEISVIDPACGSGHFLLYAFDILEKIWMKEYPDMEPADIPRKILKHNLYGIDLDMRACQLAAFNLYLKSRHRAEQAGASDFELPEISIVCADAKIADVSGAEDVFDEIADGRDDVRDALSSILDAFEEVHGLGSLLDVRGTLRELFDEEGGQQLTLTDDFSMDHTLSSFLRSLREATAEHRDEDSFLAQDLRSFVRLLDVLSQDYDVALMNPPYGSGNRMPDEVQAYVDDHYEYKSEFYINFFEVCERLVKDKGRIGMIVPRTFMFKRTFQDFREDFIGDRGSFDFLAEFGIGVLDKATVRTAGTVVRVNQEQKSSGDFYRLHDLDKGKKEDAFLSAAFETTEGPIRRHYTRDVAVFSEIPGTPLSYWVPDNIRAIYNTDTYFDADNADIDANSLGNVKQGLATGNNARYLRRFWESPNYSDWVPFAKGGSDAWILPRITRTVFWGDNGSDVKRYDGSYPRSEQHYFTEGLTYTNIKEGGRRFGYLHEDSIFGTAGQALLPQKSIWQTLSYANSHLVTYLVLALTTGRHWQVGEVSRIPWDEALDNNEELAKSSREILGSLISLRRHDFISPYYIGPLLLSIIDSNEVPLTSNNHPHRDLLELVDLPDLPSVDPAESITQMGIIAAKHRERIQADIQTCSNDIETKLFSHFDLKENKEDIYREISIRTNQNPLKEPEYDPSAINEPPEDFKRMMKDTLLHLAIKAVQTSYHGIIPQNFEAESPNIRYFPTSVISGIESLN